MFGGYGGFGAELSSDAFINSTIPGGINSFASERLDNFFSGNPNPLFGQIFGGAPEVGGGFGGYGYFD